jgi:hypothetical protein
MMYIEHGSMYTQEYIRGVPYFIFTLIFFHMLFCYFLFFISEV